MGEIFAHSGEDNDSVVAPAPRLQGIYIPGIDVSDMQDGFGLITPLGGGATARQYTQYGISNILSPQETQLHDLAIVPAEAQVFNFEGLVGPQGIPGPPGAPGITQVIIAPNSNFLTSLPHNIDQINDLGTASDQLIYTNSYTSFFDDPVWTERQPAGAGSQYWSNVVSDSDGSNLMAGIGFQGYIYTSDDYGVTWDERRPAGASTKAWGALASDSDGSHLVAGIVAGRLYTSADYGVTWTERQPKGDTSGYWNYAASNSDGSRIIIGDTGGRLWTSDDYGVTWDERRPQGEDNNKNWIRVASDSDGSHLVAAINNGRLYTSADYGVTWTERQPAGASDEAWAITTSDSDGSNLMVAINGGRLYTSADYGVTWTERQPKGAVNGNWNSGGSSSNGAILIAAESSGRLYISTDFGATWNEEQPYGASNKSYRGAIVDADGTNYIVAANNDKLYTGVTAILYSEATWAEATLTSAGRALLDDLTAAAQATTLGLGTEDTPQFAGINIGHASDTTLLRVSAGDISIEGNIIYRAEGTDVPVTDGGTGVSSLTNHGILLGSGTDAVTPLGAATDGQLPIGSTGADPVLATLTGTSKRVSVTNEAGSITLSGPQDLDTVDSPTFADALLTDFDSSETVVQILNDTVNPGVLDIVTVSDDGGRDISWTSGEIYTTNGDVVEVSSGNATCTDNATNYLIWNSGTTLTLQTSEPDDTQVAVAKISVVAGDIWEISEEPVANRLIYRIQQSLEKTFPLVVSYGLIVSEDTDATNAMDVVSSAGEYYRDIYNAHTVSQIYSRTTPLRRWYHSGGAWTNDTDAEIDNTQYDNGTNLTALTAGKWVKSLFLVSPTEIHWIYPQEQFSNLNAAIIGALPSLPSGLDAFPISTSLIMKQGATSLPASTSDQWADVRPLLGLRESPGLLFITEHSSLGGLTEDDHSQYLLVDGTRAMSGNLNMGNQNIINPGTGHDAFTDFAADEHIDHTGVTLTAGTGLTGGGDISANRIFAVDGVLEDLDTLGANSADGEFLVGTGAGVLTWESGGTVRTSLGLGTGDSPTFTGLTLSAIVAEDSDVDKFLVDSTGVIKYRTGAQVLSDIGGQPADAGLTSLAGLTYVSDSFIKVTAEDTYVIRTIAETKTDLSLDNVENTKLSTWTGSANITTVGALEAGSIAAGFTSIAVDYTDAKCTDATADNTAENETSHADVLVDGDIGGTVQAHGDVLDDLNTLGANAADSEFLVGTGAGVLDWESGATARTSLGLGSGDSPTFAGATFSDDITISKGGVINQTTGDFQVNVNTFTNTFVSPDVDCHQGYTTDGTYHYTIDTLKIQKRNDDGTWSIVTENTDPFNGLSGYDHLGDGQYYNGNLYIAGEHFGGCGDTDQQSIFIFSITDLSRVDVIDISAQGHEATGLTIAPDEGTNGIIYVMSYCDGTKIWKYDLSNFSYLGSITLSETVSLVQGIYYKDGYIWVSGNSGKIYKIDLDGQVFLAYTISATANDYEGIDYSQSTLRVLLDNGTGDKKVYFFSSSENLALSISQDSGNVKVLNDLYCGTETHPVSVLKNRGILLLREGFVELNQMSYYAGNVAAAGQRFFALSGTQASPGATLSGQGTFLGLCGHDGTNYVYGSKANIELVATENWTPTSQPSQIRFSTCTSGSTTRTQRMVIDDDGNIEIGTGSGNGGILAGLDLRTTGRAELHLLSNGINTPAEIIFGYDTRTDANIRWTISDRGRTDGGLNIYRYDSGFIVHTVFNSTGVGIGVTPKTKLTVEGTITLKEQAAADGDTAAYGQLWVKSDTPNVLMFTDDAGNDLQVAPQDLRTAASPQFAGLNVGTGTGIGVTLEAYKSTGVKLGLGDGGGVNSKVLVLQAPGTDHTYARLYSWKYGAGTGGLDLAINEGGGKVGIGLTSPKTKLTVEGTITLKEQAAADGDTAAYGQLWVKNASPNELWFTDDEGNDHQIAYVT